VAWLGGVVCISIRDGRLAPASGVVVPPLPPCRRLQKCPSHVAINSIISCRAFALGGACPPQQDRRRGPRRVDILPKARSFQFYRIEQRAGSHTSRCHAAQSPSSGCI
jgi:hypothetical protein